MYNLSENRIISNYEKKINKLDMQTSWKVKFFAAVALLDWFE
jgi:hypothetical protein